VCEIVSARRCSEDFITRNLITDVPGVRVGHADDRKLASGVTVVLFEAATVASVDVRGGGPGTCETDLLDPERTVAGIDAIALAGGSAYGLDAASGVMTFLRERGRGYPVGTVRVPIVPGAILFDLLNGGNKDWGRDPPYRELAYVASSSACEGFELGSVGAGLGATTVNLKGGVGSASAQAPDGALVGALAAVNAAGSVTVGDSAYFWAGPFEQGEEFGGRGFPSPLPPNALVPRTKAAARANTTLVVVATDAAITKAQAKRLAFMAQTGLSRAIYPVHTPLDGDVVFAAATGKRPLADPVFALTQLGATAANVVARAIARAIYEATALPFPGALPDYRRKLRG
jgi:D-aminopeptidase